MLAAVNNTMKVKWTMLGMLIFFLASVLMTFCFIWQYRMPKMKTGDNQLHSRLFITIFLPWHHWFFCRSCSINPGIKTELRVNRGERKQVRFPIVSLIDKFKPSRKSLSYCRVRVLDSLLPLFNHYSTTHIATEPLSCF